MSPRLWCAASVPKLGMPRASNEDALQFTSDLGTIAVSDGASSSLLASRWARALVARYCEQPTWDLDAEWLAPVAAGFYQGVDPTRLPWHALTKLSRGTFGSLVAGRVVDGALELVAAGDSCALVHGPGNRRAVFPDYTIEELGQDPYLLSTLPPRNLESLARVHRQRWTLGAGPTRVMLVTDAVARWLVQAPPDDDRWAQLLACTGAERFEALVHTARASGAMQDDDSTLLSVEYPAELGDASSNVE